MRPIINQLTVKGAAVAWVVDLRTHTRTWIYSLSLKLTTQRIDIFLRSFRVGFFFFFFLLFFSFFSNNGVKHPGIYHRFVSAELQ